MSARYSQEFKLKALTMLDQGATTSDVRTNWQYRKLLSYAKPTIAMVNSWCFGGAFVPLASCDLAITADDATFGLSEVTLPRPDISSTRWVIAV